MDALPQEQVVIEYRIEGDSYKAPYVNLIQASTKLPVVEPAPTKKKTPQDEEMDQLGGKLQGKAYPITTVEREIKIGEKIYRIPEYAFKDEEGVFKELSALSGTTKIRIFFPGSMGTNEYVKDRINFMFDKDGVFQRCFRG